MANANLNKLRQVTGTANSQTIAFMAGAFEYSTVRYVTLSSNYQRSPPPHYPSAIPGQKAGASLTSSSAQVIASGTRVQFYAPEAAALVAAGAAVYS